MFLRPLLASVGLATLAIFAGVTTAVPAGTAGTPNDVTPGTIRGHREVLLTHVWLTIWMKLSAQFQGTRAASTPAGAVPATPVSLEHPARYRK